MRRGACRRLGAGPPLRSGGEAYAIHRVAALRDNSRKPGCTAAPGRDWLTQTAASAYCCCCCVRAVQSWTCACTAAVHAAVPDVQLDALLIQQLPEHLGQAGLGRDLRAVRYRRCTAVLQCYRHGTAVMDRSRRRRLPSRRPDTHAPPPAHRKGRRPQRQASRCQAQHSTASQTQQVAATSH